MSSWLLLAPAALQPRHSPPSRQSILRDAKIAHAAELVSETATKFLSSAEEPFTAHRVHRSAFSAHDVGDRFAGPDREALGEAAASVHVTTQPVLTLAECVAIRLEAKVAMALGLSCAFTYTDLVNIGEVKASDLPVARRLLRRKLASTLMPLVGERFALDKSSLRVRDAVVIRYDAKKRATRQPVHRDDALVSFTIPLSAQFEYTGGGTHFEGSGAVLRPPMGRLLCHASGMRHAGNAISGGVRWLLVVFLVATNVPQPARWCQNIADSATQLLSEAEAAGDEPGATAARERANVALSTAISLAPTDFQLHHDLGLFLMEAGDDVSARRSFQRAASIYPFCPRPHLALAVLLGASGRHRAALRHYEAARAAVSRHGGGQDRNIVLDVALGAACCLLALRERHRGSLDEMQATTSALRAERLEEVVAWLRGALADSDGIETEKTSEAQQMLGQIDAAILESPKSRSGVLVGSEQ